MGSYHTLVPGSGYLKNFNDSTNSPNPFDATGGVPFIDVDFTECADDAFKRINSKLANTFPAATISGWSSVVPQIIDHIADLIGSGYAWIKKSGADINQVSGSEYITQGDGMIEEIKNGGAAITDASGNPIPKIVLINQRDLA